MFVVQHNLSLKLNGIPLGLNGKLREEKRQEKKCLLVGVSGLTSLSFIKCGCCIKHWGPLEQ